MPMEIDNHKIDMHKELIVLIFSSKWCFCSCKITKNTNTSHYKGYGGYDGYGICFDSESSFSFGNRIDAENVIIFGVNTSNNSHSTNKTQILMF